MFYPSRSKSTDLHYGYFGYIFLVIDQCTFHLYLTSGLPYCPITTRSADYSGTSPVDFFIHLSWFSELLLTYTNLSKYLTAITCDHPTERVMFGVIDIPAHTTTRMSACQYLINHSFSEFRTPDPAYVHSIRSA